MASPNTILTTTVLTLTILLSSQQPIPSDTSPKRCTVTDSVTEGTRWVAEVSPEPEKIALVFGPEPTRIELADRADSERLYSALELKRQAGTATEEDERLHAALTVALGSLRRDTVQCVDGKRKNWFGEEFWCGN